MKETVIRTRLGFAYIDEEGHVAFDYFPTPIPKDKVDFVINELKRQKLLKLSVYEIDGNKNSTINKIKMCIKRRCVKCCDECLHGKLELNDCDLLKEKERADNGTI